MSVSQGGKCSTGVLALRSFVGGRSGAAAIEFALICPALVLFILGTYAVGWAMHGVSSVDFALDRTARVLQLKPTLKTSELQKAIESVLKELGDQKVSVTMSTKTDTYGTQLAELTANYAFAVAIPFLETFKFNYQRTATVVLTVPS